MPVLGRLTAAKEGSARQQLDRSQQPAQLGLGLAERLTHPHPVVPDLEDPVIGVDPADTPQTGQRIRARRNDFSGVRPG